MGFEEEALLDTPELPGTLAPPQPERERQSAAQSIRAKILSFIIFSSNFRYSTGI